MNKKKIFLIAQSLLCAALVVMLILAALGIYREGLALKAADPGLVLGIRDENAEKPVQDTECLRDLTVSRVASASSEMQAERAKQKKFLLAGWAVFALCMVPVLLYITNGSHFPNGDLEPVFLALVGHVLPWIAIGLAALMVSTVLQEKSMRREIEAAKAQLRQEKAGGIKPEAAEKKPDRSGTVRLLRIALLVLAVVLIAAGVFNGSARDVFGKAVKICTECVGLG